MASPTLPLTLSFTQSRPIFLPPINSFQPPISDSMLAISRPQPHNFAQTRFPFPSPPTTPIPRPTIRFPVSRPIIISTPSSPHELEDTGNTFRDIQEHDKAGPDHPPLTMPPPPPPPPPLPPLLFPQHSFPSLPPRPPPPPPPSVSDTVSDECDADCRALHQDSYGARSTCSDGCVVDLVEGGCRRGRGRRCSVPDDMPALRRWLGEGGARVCMGGVRVEGRVWRWLRGCVEVGEGEGGR